MLGNQDLKSRYSTAARDIYTAGAKRFDTDRARTFIKEEYQINVRLKDLNNQTKQDIVGALKTALDPHSHGSFWYRAKFHTDELSAISEVIYDRNCSERDFRISQDSDFIISIGLDPSDIRLKTLALREKKQVMEGLMSVLKAEAKTNVLLYHFLEPRLHLDIDQHAELRNHIRNQVPQLKQIGIPSRSPEDIERRLDQDIASLLSPAASKQARDIGSFLQQAQSRLPRPFQSIENAEKLKLMASTVLALPTQIKEGLVSKIISLMTVENTERFMQTAQAIIQGCQTAYDRASLDFPEGIRSIEMTGSDLHKGHSVHIVTTTNGQKWVYKPRSIEVDQLICGREGIFAMINIMGSAQDISLPTMTFHSKRDTHGDYGYAAFIDNNPDKIIMNEAQANRYFKQLGQLAIACLALGIADLHHENIMAGASFNAEGAIGTKPFVIDGEAAFLPHKIKATRISAIEFSLYRQSGWALSNNGILSGPDFGKLHQIFEEHSRLDVPDSIHHSDTYFHSFSDGVASMKDLLSKPQTIRTISHMLKQNLSKLHHIRLIPIATSDFSRARANLPLNTDARITALMKEIQTKLGEKGIILTQPQENTVSYIRNTLLGDLNTGNIPIMHFDAEFNTITYNGTIIGEYKHGDVPSLVEEKALHIAHADISSLLENL